MAKTGQQASPVVPSAAGLDDHRASCLLLEERDQLVPAQLALENRPSALVHAVDLEHSLCGIQTDHANRHHGRLLLMVATQNVASRCLGSSTPSGSRARPRSSAGPASG